MRIEDVDISDGEVESVYTSLMLAEVIFVDWRAVKWRLRFNDVLAVENLNIEGEDLDRLEVLMNDAYVEHVRALVLEPDANVNLYGFFTTHQDEPRLRIIAGSCNVQAVNATTAAPNDVTEGER